MESSEYDDLFKHICDFTTDVIMRSFDPDMFEINPTEKEVAESHLKECQECRNFYKIILEKRLKIRLSKALKEDRKEKLEKQGVSVLPKPTPKPSLDYYSIVKAESENCPHCHDCHISFAEEDFAITKQGVKFIKRCAKCHKKFRIDN